MSEPILHEIYTMLGRIEEGQNRVRIDLDAEKQETRSHRDDILSGMKALDARLDKVETSITLSAAVDVQVRSELNSIGPTIEDFRRMRAVGLSIVAVIALGGTAFGASMMWWYDTVVSAIRTILRIQ